MLRSEHAAFSRFVPGFKNDVIYLFPDVWLQQLLKEYLKSLHNFNWTQMNTVYSEFRV